MREIWTLVMIAAVGCGPVKDNNNDASADDGGGGNEAGTCGGRGESCCVGKCDLRATCDGTVCISADVWASAPDGTFNFNGGAWQHPLVGGTTMQLPPVNGLWGTTSTFVVGVGAGLILHFDGTTWKKDISGAAGTFFAVAGSGASDIWAVGDTNFMHYNGNTWISVTPPPTNSEPWSAVFLTGPGEGWACGTAGNTARLQGGVWAKVGREGNGYDKNGLWGSSATDVWMVGAQKSLATGIILSIEHFDGQNFTDGAGALDPNHSLPVLNAVWGSDKDHVYAVGDGGTIVFWNGTLWTSMLSNTTDKLNAVWGSGPNDVWVSGDKGALHYNGIKWAPITGLSAQAAAVWLSVD
jgi:hypothetical protein